MEIGGLRSQPSATAYGEFDPVNGAGEQTDNLGAQIRYVGGSMYVFLTDDLRAAYSRAASWSRLVDQQGRARQLDALESPSGRAPSSS